MNDRLPKYVTDPNAAFAEAERRIAAWRDGEFLSLSKIPALEQIPKSISKLTNLKSILFRSTKVSDLGPLQDLKQLQQVECSHSLVTDLKKLQNIQGIRSLHCSHTAIRDLGPLRSFGQLRTLDCSFSNISDLTPLGGLRNLKTLNINGTVVCDLSPIGSCSALETLSIESLKINDVTVLRGIIDGLRCIYAHKLSCPGLPSEVLSDGRYSDCLLPLAAHLNDLEATPQPLAESKLMVLGNGRVGKTQICRVLCGQIFDEEVPSTHGITVTQAPVPGRTGARFNVWDFGGQDIYHSTHALFMQNRAVFLIVWTPEMEDNETHICDGQTFRNFPLAYWLDHVKKFAGLEAPVLVVQSKADRANQGRALNPEAQERLEEFSNASVCTISAKTPRGLETLRENLVEAYDSFNPPLIGSGRAAVKAEIERRIAEDAVRPVEARQYQLMDKPTFRALCTEKGNVVNQEMFLQFLHRSGTVFYKKGLFGDQIVLGQGWVLNAIYAVFHREACLQFLRACGGRFSRRELAALLWDNEGHSNEDQMLFISFMCSCDICFPLGNNSLRDPDAEYIASDLLPEKLDEFSRRVCWETPPSDCLERTFEVGFMPLHFIRSILSEFGSDAGYDGKYWRNGLFLFESCTQSRIMIELTSFPDWSGKLSVMAREGSAEEALGRVVDRVAGVAGRLGLSLGHERYEGRRSQKPDWDDQEPGLAFTAHPRPERECYVSYAWKTKDAPDLEDKVDLLCQARRDAGFTVHRDKDDLTVGDNLRRFMEDLGGSKRVYVFLSERYLQSVNCLFELTELWRHAGGDYQRLRKRVRIFKVDDTNIWTIPGRMKHAAFWEAKLYELESAVEMYGYTSLAPADFADLKRIRGYQSTLAEVLREIADHIQPSSWEEFLEDDFTD